MQYTKIGKSVRSIIPVLLLCALLITAVPVVYADTDGTELQVTAQPDRLVLDLGADWAGMEFELKLDTAVFPFPVAANESGILSMELGGSKTYTLTRLDAAAPAKEAPASDAPASVNNTPAPAERLPVAEKNQDDPGISETPPAADKAKSSMIPPMQLIVFLVGLIIAVGGLVVMRKVKKRRGNYDSEDEDEYEDDDEYS